MSKYKVGLKNTSSARPFGNQFRETIGKNYFPYHFKKIVARYKKTGYNIDVFRQAACLVVNPIKVNNSA